MFGSLSREERVLRLGVVVNPGVSRATLLRHITNCEKRREFEETIRDFAEENQSNFHQRIVHMDLNRDSPTFNGGFDAVVRLYRSHHSAQNNGS
jgi:hypothetical protein